MAASNPDFGPAGRLNERMRAIYALRCREQAGEFPLCLHLDDLSLVLRWEGTRREERNPNEIEYSLLKDLAHLPMLLFLACDPRWEDAAADHDDFVPQLSSVKEQVEASRLSDEAKRAQAELLGHCRRYLQSDGKAEELLRDLRPQLDFNVQHAAELRIQGMHRIMTGWFEALGESAWQKLQVVIATSHMARRENLAEQYFEWLLDDAEAAPSKKRVTKIEGLENEESAIDHFGIHRVDSLVGKTFFARPDYLHKDVLAPPVANILAGLARPFSAGQ